MALRLTLEEISYSYPLGGSEDAPALSDVSMTIDPGEVLCIAGSNGSGKSTLAQVCAGLLSPSSGRIQYGDTVIEGRRALLAFRRKIGLLFQSAEDQLFADTVENDIAFGPRSHGLGRREVRDSVLTAAETVGLPLGELGTRSPFSLSAGEMRRTALAGVLALEPEVLILDEPFVGLDHDGRERIKEALSRYNEVCGASIMIATHELADAWSLATRYGLLSGGAIVGFDDRSDLLRGEGELSSLGMKLPQWGALARELQREGISVADPSDQQALAKAIAAHREGRVGR